MILLCVYHVRARVEMAITVGFSVVVVLLSVVAEILAAAFCCHWHV